MRMSAHQRHDGGHQRDSDDAMRQEKQKVCLLVGGEPRGCGLGGLGQHIRRGSQPCDDDIAQLVDKHQQECPSCQRERLAQTRAAPVETQPPRVAGPPHHRQQDQCLRSNAQGGADAEERDLGVRHGAGGDLGAGDGDERDGSSDDHDVVQDGGEHRRAEAAAGVQDLAEHLEQAVTDDLRQAVAREHHRDAAVGGRPVRGAVEAGDERRGEQRQCSQGKQERQGCGQQFVDVRAAAVGVAAHVTDDLRHEHRVQAAAHDEHIHDIRHAVAH